MNKLAKVIQGFIISTILHLFFFTTSFANINPPKYVKTNWGNPMSSFFDINDPSSFRSDQADSVCIEIFADGVLLIYTSVYFAFNDLENYPDVYLEYDWGGLQQGITPKIESSDLQLVTIENLQMYVKVFSFTVDVSTYCDDIFSTPLSFGYSCALKMLTSNGDYVTYPTHEYDGSTEIFSADYFEENIAGQQTPPEYSGSKILCCVLDPIEGSTRFNSGGSNNGLGFIKQINEVTMVKAFPNPFNNTLTLEMPYDFSKENCQVVLQDITGRVRWKGKFSEELQLLVDTKQLEAGIYILTFLQGHQYFYKKVVKNT